MWFLVHQCHHLFFGVGSMARCLQVGDVVLIRGKSIGTGMATQRLRVFRSAGSFSKHYRAADPCCGFMNRLGAVGTSPPLLRAHRLHPMHILPLQLIPLDYLFLCAVVSTGWSPEAGVDIAEVVTIVAALPLGEGLVETLQDDFLFTPPTPASTEAPGAKASRAMAYELLVALCRPRFVSPPEGGRDGDDDGSGSAWSGGSGGGAFDVSHKLRLLPEKGRIPLRQLLSEPDV